MKNNNYKIFQKKGYFVIKNFLNKKDINLIKKEIIKAKGVDKYFDKRSIIRRIERIYNKGKKLSEINNKILIKLDDIFKEPYTIFKDKYNVKSPNGEGFFAHYDGIFQYKDKNNRIKNGWYEYGNSFINILVDLDACNKKNGTIEITSCHKGSFASLLKNTKKNYTPELLKTLEKKNKFKMIELNIGDIFIFKNTCPHRSDKNSSLSSRRTLYYTYTPEKFGSFYKQYFKDKKNSKSQKNKSLSKKN